MEYVHGLLSVNCRLHTHLEVETCSCWTGGGKSCHFSIPQAVPWNSPQLPASDNCHFSSLDPSDWIYAWTALRCYLWHLHRIQTSGSQRPFIQDAPDHCPSHRNTGWVRLGRTLGGRLVQILVQIQPARCLGPGTNSFWMGPKREIPQYRWETRASAVCSMHEQKWMLRFGCCKSEIPILPLGEGSQHLLYLTGTAIAEMMRKQKFSVSPWVTFWQLKQKFYSTKHSNSIPQKFCIQTS